MLSKLQEQHTFHRALTGAGLEPPVSPGQHQETPTQSQMSGQLTPSTSVAWYWPSPPAEGELHTHCKDLPHTALQEPPPRPNPRDIWETGPQAGPRAQAGATSQAREQTTWTPAQPF